MHIAILFVLFFSAGVLSQGLQECLDASISPALASKLKAAVVANPTSFKQVTDKATVSSAFSIILKVLQSTTSNYATAIGVGFDNSDYYSILPLAQGYYLFNARNQAVFGDVLSHYFLGASAPDLTKAPEARSPTSYDPTSRPWYQQGSGWRTYVFAAGFSGEGSLGSSAFNSFPGGVVFADRDFLEPCSPGMERSAATSLARLIVNVATQPGGDWKATIGTLLRLYQKVGNQYQTGIYFGTDEGRYYMLADCLVDSTVPGCSSGTRYVCMVSDAAITPVGSASFFPVSKDGVVGAVHSSTSYDPRLRPWYTLGNGWTTPYKFAASDLIARTFSLSYNGGVVGVDRLDTEPDSSCGPCASCPQCPTFPPSSGSGSGSSSGSGSGSGSGSNVVNINFAQLFGK